VIIVFNDIPVLIHTSIRQIVRILLHIRSFSVARNDTKKYDRPVERIPNGLERRTAFVPLALGEAQGQRPLCGDQTARVMDRRSEH
jgi:hypothetical protein